MRRFLVTAVVLLGMTVLGIRSAEGGVTVTSVIWAGHGCEGDAANATVDDQFHLILPEASQGGSRPHHP